MFSKIGHEGNHIWICKHLDLKSDLQILLHLWLSKHYYVPKRCYYCYILFVITTMSRGCSSGSKCLYLLLYSTSEDVIYSINSCESCIQPSRYQTTTDFSKKLLLPGLLKKKNNPPKPSQNLSNLFFIEMWDFNKIIVWETCLLSLDMLLIL